jgi:hypothetical protein
MSTDQQTATFSHFLRSPNEVAAAAADGGVLLTRRGEEDLVLLSAASERSNRAGMQFAVSVISAAVADWPGSFSHRLHQPFPWMIFLSQHEQEGFAAELVDVSRACASLGRFERLAQVVRQWSNTAAAYESGVTAEGSELEWLETPVPVERPS